MLTSNLLCMLYNVVVLFLLSSHDTSPRPILQWEFQYGEMSDVLCVNCPTLNQTYWSLSVDTWIFWVLQHSRMITFSSSHWYFIIIALFSISIYLSISIIANWPLKSSYTVVSIILLFMSHPIHRGSLKQQTCYMVAFPTPIYVPVCCVSEVLLPLHMQ